jgi:hypothetical protein
LTNFIKARALHHAGKETTKSILFYYDDMVGNYFNKALGHRFPAVQGTHNRPYLTARHVVQSMEQSGRSTTHTIYQPLLRCMNKVEGSIVVVGSDDSNSNYDGYKRPTTVLFCDYI